MGKRRIRGLRRGWGRSATLAEGGQTEQWRYTNWRSPSRKSQCYQKKQGRSRGSAPGVRAAKGLEFREGK